MKTGKNSCYDCGEGGFGCSNEYSSPEEIEKNLYCNCKGKAKRNSVMGEIFYVCEKCKKEKKNYVP